MAVFLWEGKTAQGRVLKGEIEAPNLEAVFAILRDRRIRPIPNRIREKGKGLDAEIKIPGFGRSKGANRDVRVAGELLRVFTEEDVALDEDTHLVGAGLQVRADPVA